MLKEWTLEIICHEVGGAHLDGRGTSLWIGNRFRGSTEACSGSRDILALAVNSFGVGVRVVNQPRQLIGFGPVVGRGGEESVKGFVHRWMACF